MEARQTCMVSDETCISSARLVAHTQGQYRTPRSECRAGWYPVLEREATCFCKVSFASFNSFTCSIAAVNGSTDALDGSSTERGAQIAFSEHACTSEHHA
eukprot:3940984-Rhodomonas_salina.2